MPVFYFLQKEDGDYLLLETGDKLIIDESIAVSDTITLTDTVGIASKSFSADDTLTLTDSVVVDFGITTVRLITDTITLTEDTIRAPVKTIFDFITVGAEPDGEIIVAPIIYISDTVTLTDTQDRNQDDAITLTDSVAVTVGTITVEDGITLTEVLFIDGAPITPPATPTAGTLDNLSEIVLKLHYGNDKRNPVRTLDLAQAAPGALRLLGDGFSPMAGELIQLWTDDSLRNEGAELLAESSRNSQLTIDYAISTTSQAALSYYQREVNAFFTECRLNSTSGQLQKVWLEYRWPDGITGLPAPTFGQLSTYYQVKAASRPRWPDDLNGQYLGLVNGLLDSVKIELTCSPAAEGLKQICGVAAGAVSLHDKGVLVASGSSSQLHYAGYVNTGLTGNFTVTGWITTNAAWASGNKYLFDYYVTAANRISVIYDASNTRFTITKIESGTTYTANSGAFAIANGDDVHLLLVQDDTTLHLYANGVSIVSVAAIASMTDGGTIALGCPATGTIDGVDVILDGWRIIPLDITSTQAAAWYAAEAPIKADGGQIGPPPFIKTKDGDSQIDNVDDTSRDNWLLIGGVGGDLPARTEIRIVTTGSYGNNQFYLGVKAQDSAYVPSGYIWHDFNATANAAFSGGGYTQQTGTSLTFTSTKTSLTPNLLYDQYLIVGRIAASGVFSLTPSFAYAEGGAFFSGKSTNSTGSGVDIIIDLGDVFIRNNAESLGSVQGLGSLINFYLRLTATISSSADCRLDFLAMIPAPYAKISTSESFGLTSARLTIEDGLAYFTDSSLAVHAPAAYLGRPLRVVPKKYNYLFMLQGKTDGSFTITETAQMTVYVTPRYELPGGMVA